MSDSKKVIEIDKSSLVTLKAEVFRLKKSEESKTRNHNPTKKINSSKAISSPVNNLKAIEVDDSIELARSKRILEQKAKYYERMSKNKVNSTLVLFENKKDDDIRDESDYIEFTDCFGRTRKVEKSEYDKIRDERDEIIEQPKEVEENIVEEIGDSFLKQREEWRKQEEVNKERSEIHYQDILFDEARLHGTAWYKFSQDHEERKIQQENLVKMREKTEQAQSQRAELKKHRDDIIKNRIKLAKERIRNKLGLPVEQTDNDDIAADDKSDDDRQKASEKAEQDAERELQREMERKRHIRPWDKGKLTGEKHSDESDDEESWAPKREKFVMSQDEWIEKQRIQRNNEFAPVYDQQPSSSKYKERSNPANIEQSVAANLRFIREKFDKKN
ncbi:coiled-coil domain-containing protein 174 isoform X2 [Chironomus tepperi]|uniref:coiled-coil domain-containing protein 174 isoform X2 n=1 Tax=Chironomus tepperi TaxID=113505 RepID=UPI00391FAE2B